MNSGAITRSAQIVDEDVLDLSLQPGFRFDRLRVFVEQTSGIEGRPMVFDEGQAVRSFTQEEAAIQF